MIPSAIRVASLFLKVGTKTDSERENEEVEAMVKPSPKKKPPRHDLRHERMDTDDPDMDRSDKDMSLNYKDATGASRVATRFLAYSKPVR